MPELAAEMAKIGLIGPHLFGIVAQDFVVLPQIQIGASSGLVHYLVGFKLGQGVQGRHDWPPSLVVAFKTSTGSGLLKADASVLRYVECSIAGLSAAASGGSSLAAMSRLSSAVMNCEFSSRARSMNALFSVIGTLGSQSDDISFSN